jgi:hypothetical protein
MGTKVSAEPNSTTPPVETDIYLVTEGMTGTPATKRKAHSIIRQSMGALDGWIPANETWAYASATTLTVPSGAASKYAVGDKIKWTANSVVIYAVVLGVADTVLTVPSVVTNYTITANYYSKGSSPIGFSHWFAFTPTGVAASNVTLTGRFSLMGRLCTVQMHIAFTGGITFTTMPTLPIAASASNINTLGLCGVGSYRDSGTATLHEGIQPKVIASATTVALSKADDTAMSASVPITWANGDYIDLWFSYEI